MAGRHYTIPYPGYVPRDEQAIALEVEREREAARRRVPVKRALRRELAARGITDITIR